MKKHPFIPFILIVFAACSGNSTEQSPTSSVDSTGQETKTPQTESTVKHVNWELGDVSNVNKIMEIYRLWDEKKPIVSTDYFADTIRINIPEVRKEIVVANNEITKKTG